MPRNESTARPALLMAGIPEQNNAIYHRIRFAVGDPVALIELPEGPFRGSVLILRDIEMERARRQARVDRVACPADFAPDEGLSGDRETATAQAATELLRRCGVRRVVADRTLPLLFADMVSRAGIDIDCDPALGVAERRSKDAQEIAWLREAQADTEAAVAMACRLISGARARADGVLMVDNQPLTSERVRFEIDVFLLKRGYLNPTSIVNGGPAAADCHDVGSGPLRTEQPIIIDVFPRNRQTRYHGDCTRTVVHGRIDSQIERMHAVVVDAKAAAIAATRAGATGEQVHQATTAVIRQAGFSVGLPPVDAPEDYCAMVHGTGHGVGLDVHEPPLLDFGGPELVVGDCLTIEPGLYCRALGGIRVEDMVVVTAEGCDNLNTLPEGLAW